MSCPLSRIYSPTPGRFLQTDPIGYKDQFNLYAYVGNDPENGIDPSGLEEKKPRPPRNKKEIIFRLIEILVEVITPDPTKTTPPVDIPVVERVAPGSPNEGKNSSSIPARLPPIIPEPVEPYIPLPF